MKFNANAKRAASRKHKFEKQGGRCHWCGRIMSMEPRTSDGRHNDLYATFEHLVERKDGGTGTANNIVLAHAVCNRWRPVIEVTA